MEILNFKARDIEILNKMVFDSSIFLEEIKNIVLQDDNTITLNIERRVFENVKRKKIFFFWERTYFYRKSSQLRFFNVKKIDIIIDKIESPMSNDFLLEIMCDSKPPALTLKTIHYGNILSIEFNDDIEISLIDLKNSSFEEGVCFGKIGYTNKEWKFFLKENKTLNN
jgi:hypothetical protein